MFETAPSASDRAALKSSMAKEIDTERTGYEDQPEPETDKQFQFRHVSDLINNIQATDWLIKGILEAGGLSVMYGDPGSYKSFVALDWALSIASGRAWNGHAVTSGPVFILIGEGHKAYGRRAKAWMLSTTQYHYDIPVFVSEKPVQVLDPQSAQVAAKSIKELQKAHGKPAMVLFDTLNRNFGPGDENSTADMTSFISILDELVGNDIARLLIHHTGHGDKTRSRGSSALKGAVDAEYQLEKNGNGVTLYCRKMKDAVEFQPMCFEPEVVTVGGTFEEPITSLYLASGGNVSPKAVKLSPQMREALSLLDLMNRKTGISCQSDWMNLCRDEEVYTKAAFYNAIKTMEDRKIINISDGYVKRH